MTRIPTILFTTLFLLAATAAAQNVSTATKFLNQLTAAATNDANTNTMPCPDGVNAEIQNATCAITSSKPNDTRVAIDYVVVLTPGARATPWETADGLTMRLIAYDGAIFVVALSGPVVIIGRSASATLTLQMAGMLPAGGTTP